MPERKDGLDDSNTNSHAVTTGSTLYIVMLKPVGSIIIYRAFPTSSDLHIARVLRDWSLVVIDELIVLSWRDREGRRL